VSYSRGHNAYSDMTPEEHKRSAFGLIRKANASAMVFPGRPMGPLPLSFDWRDEGVVTSVKDQDVCGACYAFAGAACMESYILRMGGGAMDISEQDAIDCSFGLYGPVDTPDGPIMANLGCDGGIPSEVMTFFIDNGGVDEKSYPYTSGPTNQHGVCRRPSPMVKLDGATFQDGLPVDETHLAQLLVQQGPIYTSIAAGDRKLNQLGFLELHDGIFDDDTSDWDVNHGVLLVGYGSEGGKDYWIIKNSWGVTWGSGGFGRIRRGTNTCKIATGGILFFN